MDNKRFEDKKIQGNGLTSIQIDVIVDKETGVNYLYVQSGYSGGLTAMLDSEGKPIVTK